MIVDDVIAVRFLSKPYANILNLRVGSPLLEQWLKREEINYCDELTRVIFTLPSRYEVLTHLNENVFEALKPVSGLFKSELLKLDLYCKGHVTRFATPLDAGEIIGVYNIVHCKLSFASFTR
jgi:hypothetical protein